MLYRWIEKWRRDSTLTSLLPAQRGPKAGNRRLDFERDAIIERVLDDWMSKREILPISAAHDEANRRCKRAGLPHVSRSAMEARLRARGGPSLRRKEEGPPSDIPATRRALGIVQVDHTLVDVIVVQEGTRQPIGRPWITVVFDIATSAVLGFHLSLDSPSTASVAMALGMACLPKNNWLYKVGVGIDWPMYGLPEALHLDNAKEPASPAQGAESTTIARSDRAPRTETAEILATHY